ncbi:MAG: hypothetical protein ACYCPW_06665 [Nitrososphaerales archaeon]
MNFISIHLDANWLVNGGVVFVVPEAVIIMLVILFVLFSLSSTEV